MSNRKTQKSQFPAWKAHHKHERFVRISRSMKESPAWKSLGGNAIRLYLTCMEWTYDAESRPQTVASKKLYPRDKWPDSPDVKDGDFFLNSAKVISSGIFKDDTTLRRAIKELKKYGFISCIMPGKRGRKDLKAVYRMSGEWKNITQGEITGSEKPP